MKGVQVLLLIRHLEPADRACVDSHPFLGDGFVDNILSEELG